MSKPVSVSKPGLTAHAKRAQQELQRLQSLLSETSGSHATLSTDLATALAAVSTVITDVAALT